MELREKLVLASCPFRGCVAEAPVVGDRWSEGGGAEAREQDRVFLSYVLGRWSGSSTGARLVGSVSQLSRLTVALF